MEQVSAKMFFFSTKISAEFQYFHPHKPEFSSRDENGKEQDVGQVEGELLVGEGKDLQPAKV